MVLEEHGTRLDGMQSVTLLMRSNAGGVARVTVLCHAIIAVLVKEIRHRKLAEFLHVPLTLPRVYLSCDSTRGIRLEPCFAIDLLSH